MEKKGRENSENKKEKKAAILKTKYSKAKWESHFLLTMIF